MMLRLLGSLFLAVTAAEDWFSLLQLPLPQPDNLLSPASQEARLRAAFPVAWIHVPKCGASFGNFLVDLPGVCPGIPLKAQITDYNAGTAQGAVFLRNWNLLSRFGACHGNIFRWTVHDGVGDDAAWEQHYKHRAMIMMRDPEQRLLSAYHMGTNSWPEPVEPADELEFAEKVQGCTVRMLTRPGDTPEAACGGGWGGLPTAREVQLASSRLRSDFAFVGITDQWALSMCLGHRMFGGACHLSDFVDTRITRGQEEGTPWDVEVRMTPDPWNTTVLRGFRDPYDGALYAVGLEVFNDELKRYGASWQSCQSCFKEAGVNIKS